MRLTDLYLRLSYFTVSPLLRLPEVAGYGITSACPRCYRTAWSISFDNKTYAEWHYCSRCKYTGNIISLYADQLGTTETDAIQKLSAQLLFTVPDTIISQHQKITQLQIEYNDIWNYARRMLLQPTPQHIDTISSLKWGNSKPLSPSRILNSYGKLYGLADGEQLKLKLSNYKSKIAKTSRDFVLVPYFRTPSQISEILVASKRRVFRLSAGGRYGQQDICASGLCGLQLLDQIRNDSLVITPELHAAMQLHARNFSVSDIPLPMLICPSTFSKFSFSMLTEIDAYSLIFWATTPTAALIHQAIHADGLIAITAKRKRITHIDPVRELDRIRQQAKSPIIALREWKRTTSEAKWQKLAADCFHTSVETAEIFRELCIKKKHRSYTNIIKLRNGDVILERNGSWYTREGIKLLKGIMRIEEIYRSPRSNVTRYLGYLQQKDDKYYFNVPSDKATMSWLKTFALDNGTIVDQETAAASAKSKNSFNPFYAALAISDPVVKVLPEQLGWTGDKFQLKDGFIKNGRSYTHQDMPLLDLPCFTQVHDVIAESALHMLQTDILENELLLGMLLAISSQITSSLFDCVTPDIYLADSPSYTFSQLIKFFSIQTGTSDEIHNWPTLTVTENFNVFHSDVNREKRGNLRLTAERDEELSVAVIPQIAARMLIRYLKHITAKPILPDIVDIPQLLEYTSNEIQKVFPVYATAVGNKAKHRVSVI